MPTNVIMPALELAQETGKVLRWMKAPGDTVAEGRAHRRDRDRQGHGRDRVSRLRRPEQRHRAGRRRRPGRPDHRPHRRRRAKRPASPLPSASRPPPPGSPATLSPQGRGQGEGAAPEAIKASPLARRIAEEHGVDLARIKTASGKIEKADVLAFVESRKMAPSNGAMVVRLVAASPKARRLAAERGVDLSALRGSGPGGAVLVADVPATAAPVTTRPRPSPPGPSPCPLPRGERGWVPCGGSWRSG